MELNKANATGAMSILAFASSWFVIFSAVFSDSLNSKSPFIVFYIVAGIGIVLNVIAFIQGKKKNSYMLGYELGFIGDVLFLIGGSFTLTAIILLIISAVFIFFDSV